MNKLEEVRKIIDEMLHRTIPGLHGFKYEGTIEDYTNQICQLFTPKSEDGLLSDEGLEEYIRRDYKDFAVKDETGYIQDILCWTREAQRDLTRAECQAKIEKIGEWLLMSGWEDEPTGIMLSQAIDNLRLGKLPEGIDG